MFDKSFERLATHYDKLTEHYYASWATFKDVKTPSEGGDLLNKIDGDPRHLPSTEMLFKIKVLSQLERKKERGKDYDIEYDPEDRTFKKWLRCPEYEPEMIPKEIQEKFFKDCCNRSFEFSEAEAKKHAKEFFDRSFKPVEEEAKKYFKDFVLKGRCPIDLNEKPKKNPKKDAKEKKPHLRISYQKLFKLASEYNFLAILYREDFKTLAAFLPSKDPADVIYHLTIMGNEISKDEGRIVGLLEVELPGSLKGRDKTKENSDILDEKVLTALLDDGHIPDKNGKVGVKRKILEEKIKLAQDKFEIPENTVRNHKNSIKENHGIEIEYIKK